MSAVLEQQSPFRPDDDRRKRLGQFFTGVDLARLLAALAGADRATSVIDPMVGSGDMLIGCLEHGWTPAVLAGIEIDPPAHATCCSRLSELGVSDASIVLGSAFDPVSIASLPRRSWDVVITNPPYVRYQTGAHATEGDAGLPSASQIRADLLATVDLLDALTDEDKATLRVLARSYSGLADLAVPSWLLCAGLVSIGGMLAMLVPTTWLSRDYAHPVQYILARWFDVRCVIEDADARWFPDALVRTTLVVAERVPTRPSAFHPRRSEGYLHVSVGATAADERSIVGALYPHSSDPDMCFARDVEIWRAMKRIPATIGLRHHWVPASHAASALHHSTSDRDWLPKVEPGVTQVRRATKAGPTVPREMKLALGRHDPSCQTLEDIGWRVGQGLRTGANQFFYAERGEAEGYVKVSELLGANLIPIDDELVRATIRRQSDLPATLSITADQAPGRLILLDQCALPEDLNTVPDAPYAAMSAELADYVRRAAVCNVGTADHPKFIPQLSAVAPNVRSGNPARDQPPRFWYQLPLLTDRHLPSLAIARVNNGHPATYLNVDRETVIDANFSTLWAPPGEMVTEHAMLAFMNSAWCAAALETIGTVLGGGALKVEAAHLRRLPIPTLSASDWLALDGLGRRLAVAPVTERQPLLDELDAILLKEDAGSASPRSVKRKLVKLAASRLAARSS